MYMYIYQNHLFNIEANVIVKMTYCEHFAVLYTHGGFASDNCADISGVFT